MSMSFERETASEFSEAYFDEPEVTASFSADLLEEMIEVVQPKTPHCVTKDAIVGEVIDGMAARNQGCVCVVEDGVLIGVFTERDVIRRVVNRRDPMSTPIGEVMTKDPEAVSFHDTIACVLNRMVIGGYRRVPLVDIQRRPVGIVSVRDVMRYFVERFPNQVLNVPPNPLTRHPDGTAG